jgi:hypothetical protein
MGGESVVGSGLQLFADVNHRAGCGPDSRRFRRENFRASRAQPGEYERRSPSESASGLRGREFPSGILGAAIGPEHLDWGERGELATGAIENFTVLLAALLSTIEWFAIVVSSSKQRNLSKA